ncbi:MAG: tripartite tricarboxylate transporter substrate binding protein, partial [Betaproteobacteria bacterium]|nr:tripartite tricarboxylate transporter substrate binding protein [Betaproteobacteria bacterium]
MVRKLAFSVLSLAALALPAGQAPAQTYPAKSIRLIVPFPPGGISDVLARSLSTKLGPALGQQIVVENRTGAGTTIASELVAKSSPDGYTLYLQDITT